MLGYLYSMLETIVVAISVVSLHYLSVGMDHVIELLDWLLGQLSSQFGGSYVSMSTIMDFAIVKMVFRLMYELNRWLPITHALVIAAILAMLLAVGYAIRAVIAIYKLVPVFGGH